MNRPLRLAVCFVGHFVGVRWVFRVFSWAFRGMFATLSQSVSSRRGPIYRARVYINTHEMGNGNAYLIIWKHIFGYGNTRF